MDLKTYFFDLSNEGREVFAEKCGTTRAHLQNVAYGYKKPGIALAVAIERESDRKVTRQEMLPNTYHTFWPELTAA